MSQELRSARVCIVFPGTTSRRASCFYNDGLTGWSVAGSFCWVTCGEALSQSEVAVKYRCQYVGASYTSAHETAWCSHLQNHSGTMMVPDHRCWLSFSSRCSIIFALESS